VSLTLNGFLFHEDYFLTAASSIYRNWTISAPTIEVIAQFPAHNATERPLAVILLAFFNELAGIVHRLMLSCSKQILHSDIFFKYFILLNAESKSRMQGSYRKPPLKSGHIEMPVHQLPDSVTFQLIAEYCHKNQFVSLL